MIDHRYEHVLRRLARLRWHPASEMWSASCPNGAAHKNGDRNPSLLLWVGRTGNLCCVCKSAGCRWEEIVEATGTKKTDWFPEQEKAMQTEVKPKLVTVYPYQDRAGKVVYECCRFEPGRNGTKKSFSYRRRQEGGNGWTWNLEGVTKVLYHLPELVDPAKRQHPVFVVEGEKCADAITWLGLLGTTSPCGAEHWLLEYGQYLAGRRVVILPDNDDPGWRHCLQVAGSLLCHEAAAIWIIHLPGIPDGGDVVDWLKAFPKGTPKEKMRAALVELVKAAKRWEARQ